MGAAESFETARNVVAESSIAIQRLLAETGPFQFNPTTLAKHHAAMTKIQMLARKIVEAAIDAQVECDIAGDQG